MAVNKTVVITIGDGVHASLKPMTIMDRKEFSVAYIGLV